MKLKKLNRESLVQDLDYDLLIVRWSAIFASALIYLLAKPERNMLVPPLVVLPGRQSDREPVNKHL